jgi:predicted ATPase/DNA-binding SARP family transcriptional activator
MDHRRAAVRASLFVATGHAASPVPAGLRSLLTDSGAEAVEPAPGGALAWFRSPSVAIIAAAGLQERCGRHYTNLRIGIDVDDADGRGATDIGRQASPGTTLVSAAAAIDLEPPNRLALSPAPPHGDGADADGPPLFELASARERIPNNLPIPLTSFVGREQDMAAAKRLIGDARILTLSGPPGSGKTRLALEIAEDLLGRFTDGVYFIGLAPVTDPDLVVHRIAEVLGVAQSKRDLSELLQARVRRRLLLLILDNFDQVTGAAPLLCRLAAASPQLRMIVTSCGPLRLGPEVEYRVPPLPVPEPGAEQDPAELERVASVRLFIERAAATRRQLRMADNAQEIAELCRRLDGLPLAIELAAARLGLLSPGALLNRIEQRLSVLRSGARDRPARHQTLRAAIAWSHDLLDEPHQRLFRRLAVFPGSFSPEAAAAICADNPEERGEAFEVIGSLVDHGLAQSIDGTETEPRWMLLETIREFAREKLAAAHETEMLEERHARHYAHVVGSLPRLGTAAAVQEWTKLAHEQHDLQAAFGWSTRNNDPATAARLLLGSTPLWFHGGQLSEARRWLDAIAPLLSGIPSEPRSEVLWVYGWVALFQGDWRVARRQYASCVELRREDGDLRALAQALIEGSWTKMVADQRTTGDLAEAAADAREGLELAQRAGAVVEEASGLWTLGAIAVAQGRNEEAERLTVESVALARSTDNRWWLATVLRGLGELRLGQGDLAAAKAAYRESLEAYRATQTPWGAAWVLSDLATISLAQGNLQRATRLAAAATTHTTAMGAHLVAFMRLSGQAPVRGPVSDPTIAEAWAEGQAMPLEDAIAYALEDDEGEATGAKPPSRGLRVHALGPLRVEIAGSLVRGWGGPKAGARQAQAMFAFLFDRGERGVSKDEFQEMIWPDTDLGKADLALHRTLGGLRGTLQLVTGLRHDEVIVYSNDRYRLGPGVVEWSDVAEFAARVEAASSTADDAAALGLGEQARRLVRGDFLDDCPFYGDSAWVEERRADLRDRYVDLLLMLGERYEALGNLNLAVSRYRSALSDSQLASVRAREGLARLGIVGSAA